MIAEALQSLTLSWVAIDVQVNLLGLLLLTPHYVLWPSNLHPFRMGP